MKKNYKMMIQYDGSRFYGWQRQPDQDTVQGRMENVLARMCGVEQIETIGAGRTDAGVYAKGMVANVVMETSLSVEEIRDYLNQYLPDDIAVTEVRVASDRFHARYNAIGKTYRYTCYDGTVKDVFGRKYQWTLSEKPDMERMKVAAEVLLGEHDFRNFCVNPRMKKSTVRKIDRLEVERDGDKIFFTIHGNGFLQNMVRIIVGSLVEVGCGRMEKEDLLAALNATERRKAGPTAPPQGLCLMQVDYD